MDRRAEANNTPTKNISNNNNTPMVLVMDQPSRANLLDWQDLERRGADEELPPPPIASAMRRIKMPPARTSSPKLTVSTDTDKESSSTTSSRSSTHRHRDGGGDNESLANESTLAIDFSTQASLFLQEERYEDALEAYRQALQVYGIHPIAPDLDTSNITTLQDDDKNNDSDDEMEAIHRIHFSPSNASILPTTVLRQCNAASCLRNMGALLRLLQRPDEAIVHWQQAEALYRQAKSAVAKAEAKKKAATTTTTTSSTSLQTPSTKGGSTPIANTPRSHTNSLADDLDDEDDDDDDEDDLERFFEDEGPQQATNEKDDSGDSLSLSGNGDEDSDRLCLDALLVETLQSRAALHLKHQGDLEAAVECHEGVVTLLLQKRHDEKQQSPDTTAEAPLAFHEQLATRTVQMEGVLFCPLTETEHTSMLLVSLESLESLYRARGEWGDGRATFEQALELLRQRQESKPEEPPSDDSLYMSIAHILRTLSEIYLEQGELDRAVDSLHDAMDVKLAHSTEPSQEALDAMDKMGLANEQMEQYDKALACYEKALLARSRFLGEHHIDVAKSLVNVARVMELQGNLEGGMDLYRAAQAIYAEQITADDFEVADEDADALLQIVPTVLKQGRYEEAVAYLNKCLEVTEEREGQQQADATTDTAEVAVRKNLDKSQIYFDLGRAYIGLYDYVSATICLVEAAKVEGSVSEEQVLYMLQRVEQLQREEARSTSHSSAGSRCTSRSSSSKSSSTSGVVRSTTSSHGSASRRGGRQSRALSRNVSDTLTSSFAQGDSSRSRSRSRNVSDTLTSSFVRGDSSRSRSRSRNASDTLTSSVVRGDSSRSRSGSRNGSDTLASSVGCSTSPFKESCSVNSNALEITGGDIDTIPKHENTRSLHNASPIDAFNTKKRKKKSISSGVDDADDVRGYRASVETNMTGSSSRDLLYIAQHGSTTPLTALESRSGDGASKNEHLHVHYHSVGESTLGLYHSRQENSDDDDYNNDVRSKTPPYEDEIQMGLMSSSFRTSDEYTLNDGDHLDDQLDRSAIEIDPVPVETEAAERRPPPKGFIDGETLPVSPLSPLSPLSPHSSFRSERRSLLDQSHLSSDMPSPDHNPQVQQQPPPSQEHPKPKTTSPSRGFRFRVPTARSGGSTAKSVSVSGEEKAPEVLKSRGGHTTFQRFKNRKQQFRRMRREGFKNLKEGKKVDPLQESVTESGGAAGGTGLSVEEEYHVEPELDPGTLTPVPYITVRTGSFESSVSQITFRLEDPNNSSADSSQDWWWGVTAEGFGRWFPTAYVSQAVEAAEGFLSAKAIHAKGTKQTPTPLNLTSDGESFEDDEGLGGSIEELDHPSHLGIAESKTRAATRDLSIKVGPDKENKEGGNSSPRHGSVFSSPPRRTMERLEAEVKECRDKMVRQKTKLGLTHPDVATTLFALGVLQSRCRRIDPAIDSVQEALSIQKKNGDVEDAIRSLHFLADLNLRKKECQSSLEHYKEALQLERQHFGVHSEETAKTLNCIGTVHSMGNEFAFAMKAHQEALRILKKSYGEDLKHPLMTQTLCQIGSVYYRERNSPSKVRENDYKTFIESGMLEVIGRAHEDRGSYQMAISFFEEKLQFLESQCEDPDDLGEAAVTLNSLGMLCSRAGLFSESIDYYERALSIQLQLGCDKVDLATARVLTAGVRFQLGAWEEALQMLEESVTILKDELGDEHETVAAALYQLGIVHIAVCDYDMALEVLLKAFEVQNELLGDEHPATLRTRREIANVYGVYDAGLDKSMRILEDVLVVQKRIHGERHPNVAETLHSIGRIHSRRREYTEALKVLEECYYMRVEFLGWDHPSQANTLQEIASIHLLRDRTKKAMHISDVVLEIRKDALSERHIDVARALTMKGACLVGLGNVAEAMENFDEALIMALETVNANHPLVAETYTEIGMAFLRKCQFDKARESIEKALALYMQSGLDGAHPRIRETEEKLRRVERDEMLCV